MDIRIVIILSARKQKIRINKTTMNKLLVFALIVSACYGAIPWAYKNCGTENDNMVITGIVLSAVPEKQVSDNISVVRLF